MTWKEGPVGSASSYTRENDIRSAVGTFRPSGQGIVTRRAETRSSRGSGRLLPTRARPRPPGGVAPSILAVEPSDDPGILMAGELDLAIGNPVR